MGPPVRGWFMNPSWLAGLLILWGWLVNECFGIGCIACIINSLGLAVLLFLWGWLVYESFRVVL